LDKNSHLIITKIKGVAFMENETATTGRTGMQSKGIKASHVSGVRIYFHADSETFLAVDGDELEQESNALNKL